MKIGKDPLTTMDKQTKKYLDNKFEGLEKNLDKRFEEHSKVITEAVDYKFKKVETEIKGLKTEMTATKIDLREKFTTKKEFQKFRDESLTNQDTILKKLDILLTEKKIRDYQIEKERQMWAIIIKALKERGILSPTQLKQIDRLQIF